MFPFFKLLAHLHLDARFSKKKCFLFLELVKGYCLDYAPFVCKAPMHPNKTRDDDDDDDDDVDYKKMNVGDDGMS